MSTGYSWEGIRQVRATLLGARHVPERLFGGYVYLGRYIKCSTFTTGFREFLLYITATGNPEHRPTPSQLRLSGYNFDLPNFV